MDCKKIGNLIKNLRIKHNMTQLQLAERLFVSDKTISKWERGLGCPDVSLLIELSSVLGISIEEILTGTSNQNQTKKGLQIMKKANYYICPTCGNLTVCTGLSQVNCCGTVLERCTEKKAEESQKLCVEETDGEWYVTASHPMTKNDYISFVAFASGANLFIFEQYPEWPLQARIPKRGHGKLLWYSKKEGLLYQLI